MNAMSQGCVTNFPSLFMDASIEQTIWLNHQMQGGMLELALSIQTIGFS